MRKSCVALVASGVIGVATASTAWADGYEGSIKDAPAPAPVVNWSGVYIGLHVGYGWTDVDSKYDFGHKNELLFDKVHLQKGFQDDLEGWLAGGHIGLQRQHGNWVFGIEGTLDAADLDGSSKAYWDFGHIVCPFGCFGLEGDGKQTLDVDIDDLFTIAGRLGYTHDRWLAYVKGGYASADISVSSDISGDITGCIFACIHFPIGMSGSSEKRHDGWVLGAGVEKMIHENLIFGVEYNYIDLESRTHTVDGVLEICGDCKKHIEFDKKHKIDIDPDEIHTVTARLTFLLNKREEPVAPLK